MTAQAHDRRGWLTRAAQAIFGEPDTGAQAKRDAKRELKRATSHGALMMALARFVAIPLMVIFSLGALVTLGQAPLRENLALLQAGQPLDYVSLLGLLITGVLVFAMDVAMIVAALMLRDVRTRDGGWREQAHLWLLVLFVGAMEAATFIKMVAAYEHPHTLTDWALLAGRGIGAPAIAIFLALSGERPVSRRDVQHLLQVRAGEGLITWLERTLDGEQAQEADMAQLFSFFALVNGASDEQRAWDAQVMATMERMAPASVKMLAAQDIAQAKEEARRLIETAQRQVEAANSAATQRTLDAILSLVATGALPDWLTEQRPDLAGFSLAQLAGANGGHGGRGKGSGGGGLAALPAREPASQAERVRRWLSGQGIEPCKAPEGKRGVWLRAADVDVLTDGHASASETHQALIKRLGAGLVVGRALVAPYEPTMRELSERHLLTDTARQWWAMQSHSGDDSADDGRSNVVAMRA